MTDKILAGIAQALKNEGHRCRQAMELTEARAEIERQRRVLAAVRAYYGPGKPGAKWTRQREIMAMVDAALTAPAQAQQPDTQTIKLVQAERASAVSIARFYAERTTDPREKSMALKIADDIEGAEKEPS